MLPKVQKHLCTCEFSGFQSNTTKCGISKAVVGLSSVSFIAIGLLHVVSTMITTAYSMVTLVKVTGTQSNTDGIGERKL